ncbi:hypothetical protein T07_4646 [Trichinella nelsoni]|uniref:Uncharacterized protein n=1 Tax=Trichinella nelsoni TaxID=6336 RepID=A0A0V0RPV6_9BILA|nr:hypothetical protein T07_4646 [Trichinella nelsoni]
MTSNTLVLQIFSESNYIRNHVDKYVITKHYQQLMPFNSGFRDSVKGNVTKEKATPGAMPQAKF